MKVNSRRQLALWSPKTGFDPKSIAGLKLWFDASDASTITLSTGVSQWNDKSGNGNNAVQATGSQQPTLVAGGQNGLTTIKVVSASNQYMTLTNVITPTTYTYIGVIKRADASSANAMFGNDGAATFIPYVHTNAQLFQSGNDGSFFSGGSIGTGFHLLSGDSDGGATYHAFLDAASISGARTASAKSTAINALFQRAGFASNGELAEVILYDSVLSTSNRQLVEAYLKAKWATP